MLLLASELESDIASDSIDEHSGGRNAVDSGEIRDGSSTIDSGDSESTGGTKGDMVALQCVSYCSASSLRSRSLRMLHNILSQKLP